MRKIKKDLSDSESKKVVNALLIYIVVESASFNLSKNDLYKKEIKMHVNALVKEIEKYGDIFHQLCDISIERFQSISEAAETISLMFLNGFNDEHIDIIDKVMKVITQKKYALQLAQIKSILSNVQNDGVKEDRDKLISERAINCLLIYIIALEMSKNLEITHLYNKKIPMHLIALINLLENNPRTFEGLSDFSKQNYIDIGKAVHMIAIPILNNLQAEHYPIISGSTIVATNKKYNLQLAQLEAVLINVK